MKFTLTFDGPLPSTGNSSRKSAAKWDIRKTFHPQIEELFRTHPALIAMSQSTDGRPNHFAPINVKNASFVPLVRGSPLFMVCGIDITFLRKEEPGALVLQGGDIDNRLKTLFDALRMPSKDEVRDDPSLPNPLYCLLQSDTLITRYSIATDRLLGSSSKSPHEVRLMLVVTTAVTRVTMPNLTLFGD